MKKKILILFAFCLIGFSMFSEDIRTGQCVKIFDSFIDRERAEDNIRIVNKSNAENFTVKVYGRTSVGVLWGENKYIWKLIDEAELKRKGDKCFIFTELCTYDGIYKKFKYDKYAVTIEYAVDFTYSLDIKHDDLYITINSAKVLTEKGFEEMLAKKAMQEKEQKLVDEKKYKDFLQDTYARGKTLYEKEILPLKSRTRNAPISISSYNTTVNSAGGVDVEIEFENISDKVCKYIEFDITPYNKVDDIVYDDFGNSRKTIKHTGFVQPKEKMEVSTPKPIWYSYDISYIKMNAVKITYSDNSVETIGNVQNILNAKDNCVKTVVLADEKNLKITANYDFYNDSVYIDVFKDFSGGLWSTRFDYAVIADAERYLVGDKFVDTCKSGIEVISDYKKRFSISSALWASAKKISLVHTTSSSLPGGSSSRDVLYEFSEDDVRRIKDFACICHYRNEEKGS